jgi:hypothetical protein
MFFGYKIDSFIYETMAWIVLGGFGATGLEKFARKTPEIDYNIEHKKHNRWDDERVDFHP